VRYRTNNARRGQSRFRGARPSRHYCRSEIIGLSILQKTGSSLGESGVPCRGASVAIVTFPPVVLNLSDHGLTFIFNFRSTFLSEN
jgi:hypothetical protein